MGNSEGFAPKHGTIVHYLGWFVRYIPPSLDQAKQEKNMC